MKRKVLTGLALLSLLLLPSMAQAADKAKVKVGIDGWQPIGLGLGAWTGPVKSKKNSCMKKADITLYVRTGDDNAIVGDAEVEGSNGKFTWNVVTNEPSNGKYFVLAAPRSKCNGAESKIFDYPDDQPNRKAAAKPR